MAIVAFFCEKRSRTDWGCRSFSRLIYKRIEEMDIVRKIIRAYLYNPMPEKVQRPVPFVVPERGGFAREDRSPEGGVGAARSRCRASDG